YSTTMRAGVGSIKGVFTGNVRLEDVRPPSHYKMIVDGTGQPGFLKGAGELDLEEHDGVTVVSYKGDVQVGGTIASVGQRMIQGAAKMMATQFFTAIEAEAKTEAHEPPPKHGFFRTALRWFSGWLRRMFRRKATIFAFITLTIPLAAAGAILHAQSVSDNPEGSNRLSGRLVDKSGRTAPARLVLASAADDKEIGLDLVEGDGEFNIEGIPSGRYVLYVEVMSAGKKGGEQKKRYYYPGSYKRAEARAIVFATSEVIDGYQFTLPAEITISLIQGIVVYLDGQPAPGAELWLKFKETPGAHRASNWVTGGRADEQGRFTIHGFNQNICEVNAVERLDAARAAKRQPMRSEKLEVTLTKDLDGIRLILSHPLEMPQAPPEVIKKPGSAGTGARDQGN
ncbi:MAG TPA: SRPBCC domain-containing protein, partial [Blastocatellia bacterium]